MRKELEDEVITYILEYKEKYGHTSGCLVENSISFITDERLNLKKVRKEINEFIPSKFKRLSLHFLRYFKNHFDSYTWEFISENFDISNHQFIEEFEDFLNWRRISGYRSDLTKSFIDRYEGNLHFPSIFSNPALSKKVRDYCEIKYNEIITLRVKNHFDKKELKYI